MMPSCPPRLRRPRRRDRWMTIAIVVRRRHRHGGAAFPAVSRVRGGGISISGWDGVLLLQMLMLILLHHLLDDVAVIREVLVEASGVGSTRGIECRFNRAWVLIIIKKNKRKEKRKEKGEREGTIGDKGSNSNRCRLHRRHHSVPEPNRCEMRRSPTRGFRVVLVVVGAAMQVLTIVVVAAVPFLDPPAAGCRRTVDHRRVGLLLLLVVLVRVLLLCPPPTWTCPITATTATTAAATRCSLDRTMPTMDLATTAAPPPHLMLVVVVVAVGGIVLPLLPLLLVSVVVAGWYFRTCCLRRSPKRRRRLRQTMRLKSGPMRFIVGRR
mmetsp:Transcript_21067/g.47071  ORF Transcript_21067/g.47071 Transcript_21067/m.47071 type:complete len:324 (-) Transcript_21067:298-1269(-)